MHIHVIMSCPFCKQKESCSRCFYGQMCSNILQQAAKIEADAAAAAVEAGAGAAAAPEAPAEAVVASDNNNDHKLHVPFPLSGVVRPRGYEQEMCCHSPVPEDSTRSPSPSENDYFMQRDNASPNSVSY